MKFLTRVIRINLFLLFVILGFTINFAVIKDVQTTVADSITPVLTISPTAAPRLIKTSVKRTRVITKTSQLSPSNTVIPSRPAEVTVPKVVPAVDTRCIITIDSVRYDITQFRNIHSGGDIFDCGTDMSRSFWKKHGQLELSTLQRYRI
ncbi:MAG: hypothetical protein UT63_C0068G0003 [Candidatus Gottesmanbacteria bacterium GW2011_GWC2_39_8]|uniref:Cytochrome b5 heme-binding domain-containing protein n=1 Tax=Candidatus Gottesmanbacteria bacterium GW2011_GWC2_39_8 TaxID=1618450 RepID=A0A0G0PU91_9BACT|nr:MAG: hypothetical protein UT63_C0068G0003 [Candidatus Gottesmanbacteria bacterium GW2011_GWC2_39_8]